MQNRLDNANEGVVYFSLGSNLRSAQLPNATRDAILKTFSKLNKTVLWKWEDENMPNKPDNVVILPWMPQQAILGKDK